MKKTKYKVTLPDGTVETRQSNRVYTHAVTRRYNNGTAWDRPNFCGSGVLAQKEANKGFHNITETRIIPVEIVP